MSLDFLTPAASASAPPARGSIFDSAAATAGAVVDVRDGWEVVVSCGDAAAEARAIATAGGFADVSHLTKIEIALASPQDGALDGLATPAGEGWVCPVRRDLQLIVGPPAARGRLEDLVPAGSRRIDLTASLCAVAILGPTARELIARFCALDLRGASLPVRGFRPGSIARTPGYVLREAEERFLLLSGAAYGAYLWEVVADAAEQLGVSQVGVDALAGIEVGDA